MRSLFNPIALAAALSLALPSPLLAKPAPAPAPAPAPDLSHLTADHRAALRCAAVFAIVASEQRRGEDSALAWPALAWRGKEYFVQVGSTVSKQAQLTREQVRDLLVADVAALQKQAVASKDPVGTLDALKRPCLSRLDAQVPPLEKPDLLTCSAIMQVAFDEVHEKEGMTKRAADLKTLASVLNDRAHKQLIAQGKSGNEADEAIELRREALIRETADKASEGGGDEYDVGTCFDLAKPGPPKHY